MTYMSLHIRGYPEELSEEELSKAALDNVIVSSLSEHARKCGPYGLQAWAEPRGLPIHYVDNCWARVVVSAAQLREFYAEVLGLTGEIADVASAPSSERYLIEAEEF